jgi:hypothetical protein
MGAEKWDSDEDEVQEWLGQARLGYKWKCEGGRDSRNRKATRGVEGIFGGRACEGGESNLVRVSDVEDRYVKARS